MSRPLSTYRIQLTDDHGFAAAADLLDYLDDLGVSHLYLSPVLAARPGSRHFYNVADHSLVDPVLGGEEGLRRLAALARERGMGLIGDIVPHHMGVGPWSPLWDQLLREGRSSEAAKAFDVDWETPLPGAADKVILPVLEQSYGEALAAGHLTLAQTGDEFRVCYGQLSFPVNAEWTRALERSGVEGLAGEPGDERSWQRMHSLLEQQHYRLVSWRAGGRLVNYRRFLNIDELAALRVEDEVVFDATHQTMVGLVADGVFDGLRVDHVDGLADPGRYLQRLRERIGPDAWLVVETLTAPDQSLPEDWPVDGTTGYELLRTSLGAQVDPSGLRQLNHLAAANDALPGDVERWRMKAEALDVEMGPDLRRCTRVVWTACQDEPAVRDVDYRTLLEAVSRLATALPRYRCYVDPVTGSASDTDRETMAHAVAVARDDTGRGHVPEALWTHLEAMLTGETPRWTAALGEALTRFQQLTGPVAALGVEERLFHRHHAMVAACELGCDPDDVSRTLEELHTEILAMPPTGMRTTATHDTKHSEDVRLRMAALSGLSNDWMATASVLMERNPPPDRSLGLRLLQVAVGVWPSTDDGSGPLSDVITDGLRERFGTYAIRAVRGQATISSHRDPNAAAEAAVRRWADDLLAPEGPVAESLRPLALRAAEIGMASSLSQTLLRLTVPGIPDTYQGTERWDDSLTDPDNRRPVEFGALLDAVPGLVPEAAADLWANRRDARVKQHLVRAALRLRRELSDVMGPDGGYAPVSASGRWSRHMLAFSRGPVAAPRVVVVAPRVFGRITDGGRYAPLGRIWADTDLTLPGSTGWTDVLTGQTCDSGVVNAAALLADLPVALLLADPTGPSE